MSGWGRTPPDQQLDGRPEADAEERGHRPDQLSRGPATALVVVFLGLLVGAIGTLVHLPYAVMGPGPISNVLGQTSHGDGKSSDLIVVSGHETYPTTGSLDFTTVRINGGPGYPVNAWAVLSAWINPNEDVYPVDAIFPPQQSQEDVQQENQAEMVDSQQEASAVALRKAGFTVGEKVSIASVSSEAPSGATFAKGDVLISVGGTAVAGADSARAAIQRATPGSTLDVVVDRGGTQIPLKAKTGSSNGRTILGVVLKIDFTLPFSVTIDAGQVGGPSAGLMFALGIYDKVTDGSLTGGKNIAGTGTIDASGKVGPIGGIHQKLIGARQGGASYFLAPADNCEEVRDHMPDGLQVVRVATFDDAEAAVARIGKGETSGLPGC